MKSISEQIQWHRDPETRRWKRVVNCLELCVFALSGIVIAGVMVVYGSGTGFQSIFLLFVSILIFATASLAPAVYIIDLARWQIKLIKLGFGCGMAISTLSGFLILEMQLVRT